MKRWITSCGVTGAALVLCVLVGGLLGAGTFTVQYAEGLSYLSSDPKACVNCHIMRDQYDGWQHSTHHNVATCNDCHVPADGLGKWICKADNGYRHSKGFTLQDFHEPIQITRTNAEILQQNCLRCHKEFISEILGKPNEDGCHSLETMNCVRCHQDVGHGPTR